MRTAVIALIIGALPVAAFASQSLPRANTGETGRLATITATVSRVEDRHGMIWVTHEGREMALFLASSARLTARGLPSESIAIGKTVTIQGHPSTFFANELLAERITVDGITVKLR